MERHIIHTHDAPQAIGTYSQAIRVDRTVYISGQIPLEPTTMQIAGSIGDQVHQVFHNLEAIVLAAGGTMNDIVKLNIYLIDLGNFSLVNDTMARYFSPPYPARAVVGVAALPRSALVEMDAILVLK